MQRNLTTPALILVLALFGALSTAAMWQHGYWGLLEPLFQSLAGMQVLADLAIACSLAAVWMWQDAKARGRNVWPWLALTLVAGSFGPLLYLLTQSRAPRLSMA